MSRLVGGSIAEFVGTFALMFVGGGAIIMTGSGDFSSGPALLAIALAHGLILAVMVSAVLHVSGAQFNPAVSLTLVVMGKQNVPQALVFIVFQLLGATAAALMLKVYVAQPLEVFADDVLVLGATRGVYDSVANVFALEFIATFFLMFVIVGTVVDGRGVGKGAMVGGFCIGLVVAACILCFGPMTGASMNPARTFGPDIVLMDLGGLHWVYWVSPTLGALAAGMVWKFGIGLEEDGEND